MKPIRIFRHIKCEGPGYLLDLLQQRAIPYQLITIDADGKVPQQTDDVAGLVFMGGSMSVNDPLAWIADEIQLIQHAVARNLPVLGICLGGQLIAKALGAKVYPGPCMEIGWINVMKTQASAWTEQLPEAFPVFHWHGETFDLPANAQLLLRSEQFAHQAFALGPHLALQFHVEMKADMIQEWLTLSPQDLERRCYRDHDEQAILAAIPAQLPQLQNVARILLGQWLNGCYAKTRNATFAAPA
jgi:GMP synthase-like glutamine amidotransferase